MLSPEAASPIGLEVMIYYLLLPYILGVIGLVLVLFGPYGDVLWIRVLIVSIVLSAAPLYLRRAMRYKRFVDVMRSKGWKVSSGVYFREFHRVGRLELDNIPTRDEFALTPEYRSTRSDEENLIHCVEVVRRWRKRQSRGRR